MFWLVLRCVLLGASWGVLGGLGGDLQGVFVPFRASWELLLGILCGLGGSWARWTGQADRCAFYVPYLGRFWDRLGEPRGRPNDPKTTP